VSDFYRYVPAPPPSSSVDCSRRHDEDNLPHEYQSVVPRGNRRSGVIWVATDYAPLFSKTFAG
jgi:hypothetical protein